MTAIGIVISTVMNYILGYGFVFWLGCMAFTLIGCPIILLNKAFKERKR